MAEGGYCDLERSTEETFDFLCSVCKGSKTNTEAETYCIQCQDNFCLNCVRIHENVAGMRNHEVLYRFQITARASAVFPTLPTETCKHHGHLPVDMYCQTHDTVGCSTCMVIGHINCMDRFYVPDYIRYRQVGSPTNVLLDLTTAAGKVQDLQKTLHEEIRKLSDNKDALLMQITQLRRQIIRRLDELKKNTMKTVERTSQTVVEAVLDKMKESQILMNEIRSAQNGLKSVVGNQAQLFVSMKQASDVVSRATKIVEITSKRPHHSDLFFTTDQGIQFLLQEMVVLGSIEQTGDTNSQASPQVIHLLQPPSPAEPIQLSRSQAVGTEQAARANERSKSETGQRISLVLRVTNKRLRSVKQAFDPNRCTIYSACSLDDGTILLADKANNKLKMFDNSTCRVKDSCDVPARPEQVCVISQQEAAVTCGYSSLIQFASIRRTMHTTRQIYTGFYCRGLACAHGKLYVSDKYTSVYLYSLQGHKLQKFSKSEPGQTLIYDICSLAASCDSSYIYVADYLRGLLIFDRNGKLVCSRDQQLSGASGVCLYKNGNVLVCGSGSNNVLQFTGDGKMIREVLKTSKNCTAVCWDEKNSKMIICYEDSDNMDVFDIM